MPVKCLIATSAFIEIVIFPSDGRVSTPPLARGHQRWILFLSCRLPQKDAAPGSPVERVAPCFLDCSSVIPSVHEFASSFPRVRFAR